MSNLSDKEIKEKLVTRGVASLEDDELLGLLLNGAGERDAINLAKKLLEVEKGSLAALSEYELNKLRKTESLGMKGAAVLTAAFELGRRSCAAQGAKINIIKDKRDIVELFAPRLSRLAHEEMWVVYLNSANRILEQRRISQGGVSSLVVDYKLVVKRAVELLASSFILVHNHPSGVPEPSVEDIEMTKRMSQAAMLFDILLTDHVIICGNGDYSFRQNGIIE